MVWVGGWDRLREDGLSYAKSGRRDRTDLPKTPLTAGGEPVASATEVSYGVALGALRRDTLEEPRSKRIESRPVESLGTEADCDPAG